MANEWLQHLITIDTDPVVRVWTGQGSLTLDGADYAGGGKALAVSGAETRSGDPDKRLTITLSGIPTDIRSTFLQDVGPLPVTVEWVYSSDSGESWQKVPGVLFRGRLSTPVLSEGVFEIEIETERGDVDRGRPLTWSDEDQRRRFTDDHGLEYMRQLSREGTESAWPP